MNLARIGQGILVLAVLGGCASPPPESERDQTIVITKHAPDVNFGKYKTFYLRPEIRTLDDNGELAPVDDNKAQPLLNQTTNNLLARGFTVTTKDKADLAVEMLYTQTISTTYWCYGWWDYYYWGYPGWGYYPYYGCDTAVWKSNMLSTIISDLTEARDNLGGGLGLGNGGAGGDGGLSHDIPGLWFAGVYGVALNGQQAIDGINQTYTQSPYLETAR
jgi:hypothetical protein